MYKTTIKSSRRDYTLNMVDDFKTELSKVYQPGWYIIVDEKVRDLIPGKLEGDAFSENIITVQATEEQKSYLSLAPIIEQLIEGGFKKNHSLIAIGGGITQDITAFIASIMYRGVDWYFFPTTLLAQGDSCIGSKTSINFGKYKNQIGNFYSPKEIFIDLNFLTTLDRRDLISGIGEMAHYFLVAGEADFQNYKAAYPAILEDQERLKEIIIRSLEIKKSYIEIDEFDQNERQVFNYGHSFGHAIESLTDYAVPHGVAVSIGMDIANFISVQYGYLDEAKRKEIRDFLKQIWEGYTIEDIDLADMEAALRRDKKNRDHLLGLILTKGPGKTFKVFKELDADFSNWLKTYFDVEFYK